ncbi:MAG: hypothetical protein N838_08730 [Thiohalocapsa sp. PB-PSB1]|jgi:hypothetical protein|nr:MAG: hypothetical protein N838_08730 [Thiohalocapsa sp. PB-PSB1]
MLKFNYLASLALAFGLGWGVAAFEQPAAFFADSEPAFKSAERAASEPVLAAASVSATAPTTQSIARPQRAELLAQRRYGSRCATSEEICDLEKPLIIGSPCQCPDSEAWGTAIE